MHSGDLPRSRRTVAFVVAPLLWLADGISLVALGAAARPSSTASATSTATTSWCPILGVRVRMTESGSTRRPRSSAYIAGSWSGPVDQVGSQPYTVRVRITESDGRFSATALYPELGCGGTWTQISFSSSDKVVFEETIDYNTTCVGVIPISISLDSTSSLLIASTTTASPHRRRSIQPVL